MKKCKVRVILFLNILIISHFANAQSDHGLISYVELLKHKVDENRFECGWLPDSYWKTPCCRDYTKNTIQMKFVDGKINCTIDTSSKSKKGLKIFPTKIYLNKLTNEFEIKGKITGAWKWVTPPEFKIYIGYRNDTVSYTTLNTSEYGPVYFNGEEVTEPIVIDTVPAFYLSEFKKFEAYRGKKNVGISKYKEILFDIKSKIDENSVLIFGLSDRYAEIFKIGELLK